LTLHPTLTRAAAALLTGAVAAACYSTGLRFPSSVRTIAVPVFGNDTNVRELEYAITEAVRTQILETSEVRLVSTEREADAVIRGKVVKATFPVLVGADREKILEGSAAVTVSADLIDTRSGAVLARVSGSDFAEFSTDLDETRKTATEEVLLEISRKIVLGLSQRSRDARPGDPTTRGRPATSP
jgi:hypothetical protein